MHHEKTKEPGAEGGAAFRNERVGDLMTTVVATASPAETVSVAARRMQESDCGSLPVVDTEGRPIGMITDRDIALFIAGKALDATSVDVRECMTEDIVACREDATLDYCLELMARYQVRRLPVVNAGGILVGIISQADFALDAEANTGRGKRRSVAHMVSAVSEPCCRP